MIFEMILPKDVNNSMTEDEHYLLFQTMRITNLIKFFYTILADLKPHIPQSLTSARRLEELYLAHGANLYEVLDSMGQRDRDSKNLFLRYKETLEDESTLAELDRLMNLMKHPDAEIRVLAAVRNKHTAHVATDEHYFWQTITEGEIDRDIQVGVGDTDNRIDFHFTLDMGQIYEHIKRNLLSQSTDVVEDVHKVVDAYTGVLSRLFTAIGKELFKDRLFKRPIENPK